MGSIAAGSQRAGRNQPPTRLRVYLAGGLCIEADDQVIDERQLPGPLARHILAMLAAEHTRAIGQHELTAEIWDEAPPAPWGTSLKSLISRTRAALSAAGLDGNALITGAPGIYRFNLPINGWVDIDAAKSATHNAEASLANGDLPRASSELFVAKLITQRPFLPGMTGQWVERRRADFTDLRIRALHCSARLHTAAGSFSDAARDARRVVDADPLRESSWWLLMDAEAATGDLAAAIDSYERCRVTLDQGLGISPSPATRARHAALLQKASDHLIAEGDAHRE
jgi:SARP family transcriptional regulator, regulator of embCAB operon